MGLFGGKKNKLTVQQRIVEIYKSRRLVLELIFRDGETQALAVITSIAKILNLNLDRCEDTEIMFIAGTYSDIIYRLTREDPIITIITISSLEHESWRFKNKLQIEQCVAFCLLNMKDSAFNLNSQEGMDTLNFVVDTFHQTEEYIKANKKAETGNLDDEEYGLVINKPIYTRDVEGSRYYLSQLFSEKGDALSWERRGSSIVDGINGPVDIYDSFLPSGEAYITLYLNMYGFANSKVAPKGFVLKYDSKKVKW